MILPFGKWLRGLRRDVVAEDLESIGLVSIVKALMGERRFRPSGPPGGEWNVVGHSLLVGLIFLRLRHHHGWPAEALEHVLIHDLHEAILGDIPSPIKRYLPEMKKLEAEVDAGLRAYLRGDKPDEAMCRIVERCDMIALILEAQVFNFTIETCPADVEEGVIADIVFCGGKPEWLFNPDVDREI